MSSFDSSLLSQLLGKHTINHPTDPRLRKTVYPRNIYVSYQQNLNRAFEEEGFEEEEQGDLRTQPSQVLNDIPKDSDSTIESLFETEEQKEPEQPQVYRRCDEFQLNRQQSVEPAKLVKHEIGRAFSQWSIRLPGREKNFFQLRGLTNPSSYFIADVPRFYQSQKVLFEPLVNNQGYDWSIFVQTVITLAHFVGLASEYYKPESTHLLKPFLFRPATSELVITRSVPLGEIAAVLCSNVREPGYSVLLYGISVHLGTAYTYDGTLQLPSSTFLVHSDLLILALSFLTDIGVLSADVGYYRQTESLREIEFDSSTTYGEKVTLLRGLEHHVVREVLFDRTLYFRLQPQYEEQAWYSLLALGYSDVERACPYNSLQNIYRERDFTYTYNLPLPYYCPVVSQLYF